MVKEIAVCPLSREIERSAIGPLELFAFALVVRRGVAEAGPNVREIGAGDHDRALGVVVDDGANGTQKFVASRVVLGTTARALAFADRETDLQRESPLGNGTR